jgi:hypothetical protein
MFDLPSFFAGIGSTVAVFIVVATVLCHLAGQALDRFEWDGPYDE